MKKISVVVPCYNEQEAIPYFYEEVQKVSSTMSDKCEFEFLFINDGSKDDTLNVLKNLSKEDSRVKYISFSRNFGKEAAMYAGLKEATGDYVETLEEGEYDCVATRRVTRKGEPKIRSFFARLFYKIMNAISNTDVVDGARDFRFMTRQMVNAIIEISEYNRFSKGIFGFVGFKTKWLEYENIERVAGKTKWSFWKLFLYSLEGFTAFSTKPLVLSTIMGILLCFVAFIMVIVIICNTFIFGNTVGGWLSLACIILFVGGIQLFCTGIIGQYLAKTYLEVKHRPIYIVKERNF